jgi:hypothetical protein
MSVLNTPAITNGSDSSQSVAATSNSYSDLPAMQNADNWTRPGYHELCKIANRNDAYAYHVLKKTNLGIMYDTYSDLVEKYGLQLGWVHYKTDYSTSTKTDLLAFSEGDSCAWVIRCKRIDPSKWYAVWSKSYGDRVEGSIPDTPWNSDYDGANLDKLQVWLNDAMSEVLKDIVEQSEAVEADKTFFERYKDFSLVKKTAYATVGITGVGALIYKMLDD